MFLAGGPGPGTVALWKLFTAPTRSCCCSAPSALATPEFTSAIGSAAGVTYITTPLARPERLPARGASACSPPTGRQFHTEAGPAVLYGYEAMSAILDAIRRAGSHGNDRPDVIKAFMATRDRESVLGRYSVQPSGETTLSTYGVDRVVAGSPVFWRAIDTAAPPPGGQASHAAGLKLSRRPSAAPAPG